MTTTIIFSVLTLGLGFAAGYFLSNLKKSSTEDGGEDKIGRAKEEAHRILEESKHYLHEVKTRLSHEEKELETSLKKSEEVIKQKEEISDRRENRNRGLEGNIKGLNGQIDEAKEKIQTFRTKAIEKLSHVSGIKLETALENIRSDLEKLITENKDARLAARLEEMKDESAHHAKAIVQLVAQRMTTPSSVDKNSTMVTIKEDKFKGLLIGKNGVNIEYLESLLPISIIFNLDIETIHVGGVNLLRRNIAKKAIEKLQALSKKTGKIDHPMIKAAVDEAEKDVMAFCDKKGMEHLKIMEIDPKTVDPQLINYVGRMYYRTSFGQNVIWHSTEMAFLARMISEQIGADSHIAGEGAFYHDIGKAVDHDLGGAHDDHSKEILERFKYEPGIVHAAFAHHDKVPCESPEDFIVKAVDAISAVRPGARQESVTNYFERIKQLEETAGSFEGVKKTYAISAGREVRVIVDNEKIEDGGMENLAEGIAGKISEELSFPGIIKVNLIRYTKSTDYAREKSHEYGRKPATK